MIDEKKLIEEINDIKSTLTGSLNYKWLILESLNNYKELVLEIIENQPKVGEWIPCSERLPEEWENVLISTRKGEVAIANMMEELDGNIYFDESFDITYSWKLDEVIAWQPLPKPYKGELKDECTK